MLSNLGTEGMAAEDGPGPAAGPNRWDQWILPHGTGAGPTDEGVCYWLTRPLRHNGAGGQGASGRSVSGNPDRLISVGRGTNLSDMGRPVLATLAVFASGCFLLLAGCGGNLAPSTTATRSAPKVPVDEVAHHRVERSIVLDEGAFTAQPPGNARARVSLSHAESLMLAAYSHVADATTYDPGLLSLGRVTLSLKQIAGLPVYQSRLAWIAFVQQFTAPPCGASGGVPRSSSTSSDVSPFFYVMILDAQTGKAALEYQTEGTGDCGSSFGGPYLHRAKERLSVPWTLVSQQAAAPPGSLPTWVVRYTVPACGSLDRESGYLSSSGKAALLILLSVPLDPPPHCSPARTITRSWPAFGGELDHAPTGITSGVASNGSLVMF